MSVPEAFGSGCSLAGGRPLKGGACTGRALGRSALTTSRTGVALTCYNVGHVEHLCLCHALVPMELHTTGEVARVCYHLHNLPK